jgi:hypothetical protein
VYLYYHSLSNRAQLGKGWPETINHDHGVAYNYAA